MAPPDGYLLVNGGFLGRPKSWVESGESTGTDGCSVQVVTLVVTAAGVHHRTHQSDSRNTCLPLFRLDRWVSRPIIEVVESDWHKRAGLPLVDFIVTVYWGDRRDVDLIFTVTEAIGALGYFC